MNITDDQLRAAYAREKPYRHTWPATFEEANDDPLIHRILVSFARAAVPATQRAGKVQRRGNILPRQRELEALDDQPAPRRLWQGPHLAPGEIDRKKAASGDDSDKE